MYGQVWGKQILDKIMSTKIESLPVNLCEADIGKIWLLAST